MKKNYISPAIEVEKMEMDFSILADSEDPDFGTTVIPSGSDDDDDESEEIRSKGNNLFLSYDEEW